MVVAHRMVRDWNNFFDCRNKMAAAVLFTDEKRRSKRSTERDDEKRG